MKLGSKAQTMEMIELVVLVVGAVLLLLISYTFSTRTASISRSAVEENLFNRVGDAIIDFQFAKVSGTEKTLSYMLADVITNKSNSTVYYGKGYGTIEVDDLIIDFFTKHFEKNWQFTVQSFASITGTIDILIDSSGSMVDDAQDIRDRVSQITDAANKRNLKVNVFMLPGWRRWFGCEILEGKFPCRDLLNCNLHGQTEEDWGDGAACLSKDEKPTAIIILSDEMSTSSNVGCIGSPPPIFWADASLENGISSAKQSKTRVYTIRTAVLYFVECAPRIKEMMTKFSQETGGSYYETSELRGAGTIVEEIVKSIPPPGGLIKLGYDVPSDTSRVRTFGINIPLSSTDGTVIKGQLKVWQ